MTSKAEYERLDKSGAWVPLYGVGTYKGGMSHDDLIDVLEALEQIWSIKIVARRAPYGKLGLETGSWRREFKVIFLDSDLHKGVFNSVGEAVNWALEARKRLTDARSSSLL